MVMTSAMAAVTKSVSFGITENTSCIGWYEDWENEATSDGSVAPYILARTWATLVRDIGVSFFDTSRFQTPFPFGHSVSGSWLTLRACLSSTGL